MYDAGGNLAKSTVVEQYAPLVERIAAHIYSRLPMNIQFDDLVQNGMVGLLDALERFEEKQIAKFETYAAQRIRGAILDGLRELDWAPRRVRSDMRRVELQIRQLEHSLGRAPSEGEIAEGLGMSLAQYQHLLYESRAHQLLYLDDFEEEGSEGWLAHYQSEDGGVDPAEMMEREDFQHTLVKAIAHLPEREQQVMGLYYEQSLNFREIGEVLDITESRVCQIHGQSLARLRSFLSAADNAVAYKK